MDRSYVVEHDLVARYLRGKLAKAESEEFEAFFLEDEETLEEVELMSVLWADPDADATSADDPSTESHAPSVTPISDAHPDGTVIGQSTEEGRWHLPLALAASLSIGFVAGAMLMARGPSAPPSGSLVLLDVATLRSAQAQAISVPASASYAAFRVAIGEQDGPVDLVLQRDDEAVARVDGLRTDGYGDVTFVVSAAQLDPGPYRVSATRADTGTLVYQTTIELTGE